MKKGFTLVELLVVMGIIAMLTGAVGTSVSQARERARIAKATADVQQMTNAILAYENYTDDYELDPMERKEATSSTMAFILGNGGSDRNGNQIPVLFNASISNDGTIKDPWGRPYYVTIREGNIPGLQSRSYESGYYLPNYYRLSVEEHNE